MDMPTSLSELTKLFEELGAPDPKGWARSQIDEGIPQLVRFLFLRQAWKRVVSEDDSSWIDAAIARAQAHPEEPYAGQGQALASLRRKGATDEELTDLVRGAQAQLLSDFCYLLGDPDLREPVVADINWALVQVDDEGRVLEMIDGLHESVLETDPTGREMRPRRQS